MRTVRTPNDYIIEGSTCLIGCYTIKCKLVGYTVIDTEDIDKCKPYKLCFVGGYIVVGNGTEIRLHHLILGGKPDNGLFVDHINGDVWDNRKCNLRFCTNQQNTFNSGPSRSNTSGYKGVYWYKRDANWEVKIGLDYKNIFIGRFKTKEEAALAYNEAALKYHGEFAYQNIIKPVLKRRPNSELSL